MEKGTRHDGELTRHWNRSANTGKEQNAPKTDMLDVA